MSETLELDGHSVEITRPDKVLFPDGTGGPITKGDLVDYYRRVAETMLPHVAGRPISMLRFPDGIEGSRFFQKDTPDYFPGWIHTETVAKEGGTVRHVVIDDAATLVYLANQACITPHVWLSRVGHLDRPDRMILDLDPPDGAEDLGRLRRAVRWTRDLLQEVGLDPFLMTTGSRGFHVVVVLEPEEGFDSVRAFARAAAEVLVARHPDRLTVETRKAKRGDRIFVDYLRNGYAQTGVPPYAVRARPGAPVATPVGWDELPGLGPRRYTVANLFRRLSQKRDPWSAIDRHGTTLGKARERLRALVPALLVALLAVAPSLRAQTPEASHWWSEVDRVERFLHEGRFKTAAREAGKLRDEVMRVSWRGPDLGQVFSELAFLSAVADANLGDDDGALWEWYVAQAHERVAGPARGGSPLAERDLAAYGKAADLLPGHPLRQRGEAPGGAEVPEATPLNGLELPSAPPYEATGLANVNVEKERLTPVTFEVWVDADGRLHQPVITSPWTPPVILQWGFDNLRLMGRFTPARLDGKPIGALQDVELGFTQPKRW